LRTDCFIFSTVLLRCYQVQATEIAVAVEVEETEFPWMQQSTAENLR
jgi:hypothetical protein